MQLLARALIAASVLALSACGTLERGPINEFVAEVGPGSPEYIPDSGDDGTTIVGLAFSGGGTRAAAFAYGVMRELDGQVIDLHPYRRTMLDNVRMVSGTSGGAVAAAYFAQRGPLSYGDFRERFLVQDVESSLRIGISPVNVVRLLRGGVNDLENLPRWLDDNLFDGGTFADFKRPDAPIVWITASDIFHGTPFLFTYDTFAALCSNLDKVRIADAVAASAAVPGAFLPLTISAEAPDCGYAPPAWLTRALEDPEASLRLSAYARALQNYSNQAKPAHVRLLDGGLTDNTGTTGFALERAAATTRHGPLSPREAVRLRTLIYIAADAGRQVTPQWADLPHGPSLIQLIPSLTHTAITSSMRDGYDALDLAMVQWRGELIAYRCGLSRAEVMRHRGTLAGWDCRDVEILVEHLSFRDSDPRMQDALFQIPTRLALPEEQIDMVVEAGRQAVRGRASVMRAIAAIKRQAGVTETLISAR